MMAKFNGKKGKNRNLAESVLNAYFNSAGIGTKGSKPVKVYQKGGSTGDPKNVIQRRGVRNNYDKEGNLTGESTHLMRTEYVDGRGWVGFPSLFQNSAPLADDSENWVDMSNLPQKGWRPVYEEALKRGEVYDFGEDKEAALAFGEGSWKPKKSEGVLKMHYGGGVPHAQTPGHEMFYQTLNQDLWNTNEVGTGNFGTIQNPNMGFFNTGIGGETGLGMEGAGLRHSMPSSSTVNPKNYNSGNDNPAGTGLDPGKVAAAQAAHLKKEGLQALGAQALGSFGTMIAQSDDTTDNVRPSSSERDILGSAMSGAAGGMALGPYGALAGAAIGVGTELFASNKAGKQWDEDMLERRENRQSQMGDAALEYSNYMKGTYNSQGGDNYYAKYGGAVADFLKKYGLGGSTSNSEFEKAFTAARQAGQPTFMFQGKPYTTDRADQSEGASTQDAPNFMLAHPDTLGGVSTAYPNQDFRSESMRLYGFEQPNDGPITNLSFAPMLAGGFQGLGIKSLVKEGVKNTAKTQLSNVQATSRLDDLAYSIQKRFGNRNVGKDLQLESTTKGQDAMYNLQRLFGNRNYNLNLGGATRQADYETEGGEVMLASPGDAPVAVGNGNYKQVASNLYQAEGPGHEAGGIATQGATEPFMDASGQSHDSPYVFSDSEDMTFDATDILKLIS